MKNYYKTILLFLILLFVESSFAAEIKINKFRYSLTSSKTRLVFDTTAPVKYKVTTFEKKIIVEIKNGRLTTGLNTIGLSRTSVSSMLSTQDRNNLHLVINLKQPVKVKHFLLFNPNRLVLDLYSLGVAQHLTKEKLNKRSIKNSELEKELVNRIQRASNKSGPLRDIVIVIDPGHGGKDPGAIGYRKTLEKNITLAVAKVLQKKINQISGFKAVLTRNGDYYVSLRQRLAIAHKNRADMFISIHADAYLHRRAHGASVFALSQRGATSEAARWLAKKENESELGQVISDKDEILRSVLLDLAQTATISASLDIGKGILRGLSNIVVLHSPAVEQASFVVLKAPDIPSLLVELGFLSHKKEELNLRSSRYQQKLADKLAKGIQSYFVRRPPAGTYLAKKR